MAIEYPAARVMDPIGNSKSEKPRRRLQTVFAHKRLCRLSRGSLSIFYRERRNGGLCEFTSHFPKSETYGLVLQMRRAAVSIPANIAEGFRRRGKADKVRFLNTSEASLEESRYHLILSEDLKYGETGKRLHSLEIVSRLTNAYLKAILDSSSDS